jgi:hypothetical protein
VVDMVEQGDQPVLEQRQPMFHPGLPPPFADGLIQRIAGCGRPEQLAIAGAEPLDARLVQQRLAGREQGKAVQMPLRALIGRVKAAQRFHLVAEKIDAHTAGLARRVEIDDAAAHRELALIGHRVDTDEAVGDQQLGQRVAVDPRAGLQAGRQLADAKRGQGALRDRGDGGQDQLAALRRSLQRCQGRQPVGADPHAGPRPVIGQAVPCRKTVHRQFGGEKGGRIRDCRHRRVVGRDIDQSPVACPCEIRQQQRQKTVGDTRQRVRALPRDNGGNCVAHGRGM